MTETYKRPSWDEYFLQLVDMVGSRGTCDRGRAGSVIVKNKRILTTGYVGAPSGLPSCDDVGHEMHTVTQEDGTISKHCIRTSHAEQNAINNAARVGIAVEGATLYCKMTPCYKCAQSIINAGIIRVVSLKDYHGGSRSKEIFKEAGVQFELLNNEMVTYSNMK
ncbi:MAG: cytidine/deoxycytidylate deaminase family protein [bacterium]